jgi:hypothetical protein
MLAKIFVLLLILAIPSFAADLPSSHIKHVDAPKTISLQNVDPVSSQEIKDLLMPLKPWQPMDMPDLGHWSSEYPLSYVQGLNGETLTKISRNRQGQELLTREGVPNSLLFFANEFEPMPKSVLNESTGMKPKVIA